MNLKANTSLHSRHPSSMVSVSSNTNTTDERVGLRVLGPGVYTSMGGCSCLYTFSFLFFILLLLCIVIVIVILLRTYTASYNLTKKIYKNKKK